MFLHIGEGKLIKKRNVVGIFDLETTSVSKKTRDFLRINEKKGNIEYISDEIPKTYIICNSKKEKKGNMEEVEKLYALVEE